MALIGNISLLHKSPAKYTTGTVGFNDRANWNKPGMMRSRGDLTISTLWKYDAVPSGFYAGRAFLPPQTAGRMTSRTAITIDAAADGAMGLPGAAASSFTIDAAAIGGLFAGGVASANIDVSASASIAGLAAGSASGTITIDAAAQISAIAWGVANGTINIDADAIAYALGYMQASTVDTSVMTPATISEAVWQYLISGTAAQDLLSAAGAAGDPLLGTVEGSLTLRDAQRIILAALAGTTQKTGNTITFKSLDGTTDRIAGSFDAENNRTGVILNAD